MDISQVMGFTAEELEQILLNGCDTQGNTLVTDCELARESNSYYCISWMPIAAFLSFH